MGGHFSGCPVTFGGQGWERAAATTWDLIVPPCAPWSATVSRKMIPTSGRWTRTIRTRASVHLYARPALLSPSLEASSTMRTSAS